MHKGIILLVESDNCDTENPKEDVVSKVRDFMEED